MTVNEILAMVETLKQQVKETEETLTNSGGVVKGAVLAAEHAGSAWRAIGYALDALTN